MVNFQAVAVNNLGKWKTAAQMSALTILLLIRDSRFHSFFLSGVNSNLKLFHLSSIYLCYLASAKYLQPCRTRGTCNFWCWIALYISMASCVVISRVHEEDMEGIASVEIF